MKINIIFKDNILSVVNEVNYDIPFDGLVKELVKCCSSEISYSVTSGIRYYKFKLGAISVKISSKYFKKLLKCKTQKSADKTFDNLQNYVQKRYEKFEKLKKKAHEKSFLIEVDV